jgi:hypothetical protein
MVKELAETEPPKLTVVEAPISETSLKVEEERILRVEFAL